MIEIDDSDVMRSFWALEDDMPMVCAVGVRSALEDAKAEAYVGAPRRSGQLAAGITDPVVTLTSRGADGSIESTAKHSLFVSEGTKAHRIQARRRNALRWEGANGEHYATSVSHPGTRPNDFWRNAERVAAESLEVEVGKQVTLACNKL